MTTWAIPHFPGLLLKRWELKFLFGFLSLDSRHLHEGIWLFVFFVGLVIGVSPVPGAGFLTMQGALLSPSGSLSASVFRLTSFITSFSVKAVRGSGFLIKVSGA